MPAMLMMFVHLVFFVAMTCMMVFVTRVISVVMAVSAMIVGLMLVTLIVIFHFHPVFSGGG